MALHFLHPWLVMIAAAFAVLAGALLARRRKYAPFLFTLGAAAFFLSGARPELGTAQQEVRHALVIDVSGSMDSRRSQIDAFAQEVVSGVTLPSQHRFVRYELSDALRNPGAVHGQSTEYGRLRDLASDDSINGEVVLITDGQGSIKDMYEALNPQRLILLRAPTPSQPDAAVVSLSTPGYVPKHGSVTARATIQCDADADVAWKLLVDGAEIAHGTERLRTGVPMSFARTINAAGDGLQRVRLRIELQGDREPRNDEASSAFFVGGEREILYCVTASPSDSDAVLATLKTDSGNRVRVTHKLPVTRSELESTGLVVINNLSLSESGVTQDELGVLADWVAEGGNLLMVGTDSAFGPGGYNGSPLEALMPVRFRPDDSPPRQLLLLLDVSASMNDSLPGGGSKLLRLKEAARRVLETVGEEDRVSVVGFREGIRGDVSFMRSDDERLGIAIEGLAAEGSTHIGSSLNQALSAFDGGENNSILMITDGDDVENAGQPLFETIGQGLADQKTRLDVVLTSEASRPWVGWILNQSSNPDAHLWTVEGAGFEGLIETLEHALAGQKLEWVLNQPLEVPDISARLPRIVRTAVRQNPGVETILTARTTGDATSLYPLMATRQLVGRTACLCTDSWGGSALADFWADAEFQRLAGKVIQFVLETANRVNLVLNALPDGSAELVWTGRGDPPSGNLETDSRLVVPSAGPGRWLLDDWPIGDQLTLTKDGQLLQRVPLPTPVAHELRYTGDSPVFFEVAAQGGVRVFRSLDSWQPRAFHQAPDSPTDLTWAPALLAVLCVIGGFAARRR